MNEPTTTETYPHSFYCPDSEWRLAMARAKENGETMTDVLRRAIRRYANSEGTDALADSIRRALQEHES